MSEITPYGSGSSGTGEPFLPCVRSGPAIWISGMVGMKADGTIPEDTVDQFEIALHAMDTALRRAGGMPERIVSSALPDRHERPGPHQPDRQRYFRVRGFCAGGSVRSGRPAHESRDRGERLGPGNPRRSVRHRKVYPLPLSSTGRRSCIPARNGVYPPARACSDRRGVEIRIEIMAVPKRKTTPSKRNMRRAHDAIKADAYVESGHG